MKDTTSPTGKGNKMKNVLLRNEDGKVAKFIRVSGIVKGKGRDEILAEFRNHPEFEYAETNVRRYTASDIYASRLGKAI